MGFLFGDGRSGAQSTTSAISAPTRMPTPNNAVARQAALRKRNEIFGRSGRSSTILSRREGGEAGTGAYNNSLLGQAG